MKQRDRQKLSELEAAGTSESFTHREATETRYSHMSYRWPRSGYGMRLLDRMPLSLGDRPRDRHSMFGIGENQSGFARLQEEKDAFLPAE